MQKDMCLAFIYKSRRHKRGGCGSTLVYQLVLLASRLVMNVELEGWTRIGSAEQQNRQHEIIEAVVYNRDNTERPTIDALEC